MEGAISPAMQTDAETAATICGGDKVTTSTAEELERLHGWLGNLIEELEEVRGAVAALYASEEGEN